VGEVCEFARYELEFLRMPEYGVSHGNITGRQYSYPWAARDAKTANAFQANVRSFWWWCVWCAVVRRRQSCVYLHVKVRWWGDALMPLFGGSRNAVS
jgi:hypothetical protein